NYLRARGAQVRLEHQLRGMRFAAQRVEALDFGDEIVALGDADAVILAVPPYAAASLVAGLSVPNEYRAIVNAHFRIEPPAGQPPILGVINGTTQWVFAFPGRLSVTVSAGDALLDTPREQLARAIWAEVAQAAALPAEPLPPWQIVRERRATLAATPAQDKKRPGPRTAWRNLLLAGDWTDTGLPATIEGAIRSGNRAAELLRQMQP
ncbi:MAG: FAD-dependent oxidoreductase, partial [Xanthobacteraceae bacterium]